MSEAILTVAQMRAAEQAMFDGGMPEYALMERAGLAAAEIIWRAGGLRETLILCGPGNNGGDGFVIARALKARGVSVRVAAMGPSCTPSSLQARAAWDGPVEDIMTAPSAPQLVDALFGTGLTRELDAAVADRLGVLVEATHHNYAIDLPSGIGTDSGECLSPVPRFGLCIALGALKAAHVLRPASGHFSRLVCVDIGLSLKNATAHRLTPPHLQAPGADAHKYTRGLVAILSGAMPGAAALASLAAAHGGAGYVRLVGGDRNARLPHAIVSVDSAEAFSDPRIAVTLVGPGLGRDDVAQQRMVNALAAGHAVVVDADGLLALGQSGLGVLPAKAILTPHGGEFTALFGTLPGNRIDQARTAAARAHAVVVLKGSDTIIAAPNGRIAVATCASSWLSTAGTGDVLAGLCAARLAVTGDPFQAACEAVWLHGDAARRAGAAFVADDLIKQLPAAIAARL